MRGDLLFWPGDPKSLTDRIIRAVTRGPFVHVAVDHGDGWCIGARSREGVCEQAIPSGLTSYSPRPFDREPGFHFLHSELGKPYGYSNVVNVVLRTLKLPYRITRLGHYDCSSLVAHYLQHIGEDISDEPDSLSPNDLARMLGILKA